MAGLARVVRIAPPQRAGGPTPAVAPSVRTGMDARQKTRARQGGTKPDADLMEVCGFPAG